MAKNALTAALEIISQGGAAKSTNEVRIRHQPYYHRQTYETTGHQSLDFFNRPFSKWETNFPGQGGALPAGHAYLLQSMSFRYEISTTNTLASDSAITGLDEVEKIRTLLERGLVNMSIGDRKLLSDVYSLTTFPQNGGVVVMGSVGMAGDTDAASLAVNVSNGMPYEANRFLFGPAGEVLGESENFKVSVEYESLVTVSNAGKLICTLDGYLATFANA